MRLCVKRALFSLLLALVPTSLYADSLPEHRAADPKAEPVTEENLLASERFWPYHVELTKRWQGAGGSQPLPAGTMGVLIRVEASGLARIDFGRDGLYQVPVGATELVEDANRIRRGELRKMAPNFVLSIAPRLVDSAGPTLRPYLAATAAKHRGFLTVFANPDAEGFADLARALAPLSNRAGVLTILLPQGEHPDAKISDKLRSLGWTVPFVYDFLADTYTRSLLAQATPLPAVVLQTDEGRVLFQGAWSADAVQKLRAALDDSFASTGDTAAVVAPERR
jgi:hypothetical protein